MIDVRRGRVVFPRERCARARAIAAGVAALAATCIAAPPAWAQGASPAGGTPAVRLGHVSVQEKRNQPLTVFVDGVEAGPAPWEGDLEEGPHAVFGKSGTLTTVLQRFAVAAGGNVAVELTALPRATPAAPAIAVRPPAPGARSGPRNPPETETRNGASSAPSAEGPYGGFEAQLLLEPGGTHTDICSSPDVMNCSTSAPIGGGLVAYAGYAVAPIGIDAMVGFQVDAAGVSGKVAGTAATLTIPRIGGIFAVRGRVAWDSPAFGASLAVGVGAAVRDVVLIALSATSKAYVAPGIVVDGALRARFTPTTALSFGLMLWGENAGRDVALKVNPLTAAVHVVDSTQFFALPYVGLEFGR